MNPVERRKHPRITTHLPLELEHDTLSITTKTKDLSCAGVYCQTPKPLPLMSRIAITMFLPCTSSHGATISKRVRPFLKKDEEGLFFKIKCEGVVVRSESTILPEASCAHHNIAIFFTDLTEADRKTIAQYVEDSLSKESKTTASI